ncbi:MAG: 16S rRNA (uracil(1498)-N(3))-methyltransferase [Clostridia bacterium]|nr:16S rRNA (uracil(1498)-N(3))-methyltransferase [Clostridia bacterium]
MPRFFEKVTGDDVIISGENAQHIAKSLRMSSGECITLCDDGIDYHCEIQSVNADSVHCRVVKKEQNLTEPDVQVTLYQCVPKSDKLEYVVQKAVELGVSAVVPVLSERCVSRPDEKSAHKKGQRYNKIALEACKQSGRGKVVEVLPMISFAKAVDQIKNFDAAVLFYEGGGAPLKEIIAKQKSVCIFIGPEGGFAPEEVELARQNGAVAATLGKRILRTETAPIAALTAVMLLTGNME